MKQKQNIKTRAEVASPLSPLSASPELAGGQRRWENCVDWRQIVIREKANSLLPFTPPLEGQGGGHKDYSQGLGRDGPPGRARSPGTLANPFPDHPPDNTWKVRLINYYNETRKTKPYSPQPPPVGDHFPLSSRREGSTPNGGQG